MDASSLYSKNLSQFIYYCNQPNNVHHQQPPSMNKITNQSQTSLTSSSSRSSESAGSGGTGVSPSVTGKWASNLLIECAKAITEKESSNKIHHLLWLLNELASPYGDIEQKLASYFLQALFCMAMESGTGCYRMLSMVAEKNYSFESARNVILEFQEVSPWTTFGHVASNGAILEALEGESKLHIIDISNTFCTQWPTFLEALATRPDETPRVKLTVVVTDGTGRLAMKEIGQRMEKFARLMGVPFEFLVVNGLTRLGELTKEELGVQDHEAVAVNCIGTLRRVKLGERIGFIRMLRGIKPKVVTVVEEEVDFTASSSSSSNSTDGFFKCFEECLRFYTLFFEMLEESFVPTSNERLILERECSRSIVRVLACDGDHGSVVEESEEIRERGKQWFEKLKEGFQPVGYSDDVVDDVRALLTRYRAGWSFVSAQGEEESGLYLRWKEEPVVWASAWKP